MYPPLLSIDTRLFIPGDGARIGGLIPAPKGEGADAELASPPVVMTFSLTVLRGDGGGASLDGRSLLISFWKPMALSPPPYDGPPATPPMPPFPKGLGDRLYPTGLVVGCSGAPQGEYVPLARTGTDPGV